MSVIDNILEVVGNTPMIRLRELETGAAAIYAKLEHLNPGGSVKDRVALGMIEELERSGELKPGGTVVEASSGNMGIGLAMISAAKGYKCIIVLTDKASLERRQIITAYGAKVVVTSSSLQEDHKDFYINLAKKIADETPGAILINQFHNPLNSLVHYKTTAKEIWEQMDGKVDAFVIGMGSTGTIMGVARYLKEKDPNILIIGVDPEGSILKVVKETGIMNTPMPFNVEGIGSVFLPQILDYSLIDEIISVDDKISFNTALEITRKKGILCGGSSGSAVAVSQMIAKRLGQGKNVITILPDTGTRYLSKMYSDEWMKAHNF